MAGAFEGFMPTSQSGDGALRERAGTMGWARFGGGQEAHSPGKKQTATTKGNNHTCAYHHCCPEFRDSGHLGQAGQRRQDLKTGQRADSAEESQACF